MSESPVVDTSKYDYELIFISDMIETCKKSPEITINARPDLSRFIKNNSTNSTPNFSDVRITVFIPVTPESQERKYSNNDVKEFWRNIFRQCGIKDTWFWDQIHIDWISNGELPNRLKPTT
jgi:hypothetical protein